MVLAPSRQPTGTAPRVPSLVLALLLAGTVFAGPATAAPTIDPELAALLPAIDPGRQLGVVLTFDGDLVTDAQVAALEALGITTGVRMVNFPIVAVNADAAQIGALSGWGDLRSIVRNAPLTHYLHQTNVQMETPRLRTDAALTAANGGLPVTGRGVTIAINDTGIDGTHQDLTYDPLNPAAGKTIQNVQLAMSDKDGLVVRLDTLGNPVAGILPPVYAENVIDTDTHGGHGSHVAGLAAGSGLASGGLYPGIAPGAKLVGLGSGATLFVVGQVAAFDWAYTNRLRYGIRVINNSWGNAAVPVDPDHPVNVATRKLNDVAHMAVVFANGNDGPAPNTQNRWASTPWVITAGAATKDGKLASFSSRGIFGDPDIHPTVLTPGSGGPATGGFTSAVIGPRSRLNVVANGLNSDLEIPPAHRANYTQIVGTSMAAPHLAGAIALVLDAAPGLLPGQVRQVIERTATPLAPYDLFEAGAGLVNVHAAVDLAFNPGKPYGNFGFTGKGLALQEPAPTVIDDVLPAGSAASHGFVVPAHTRFTFVQLDWTAAVGEDELVIDNTDFILEDMALTVRRGGAQVASSNAINLGALFGAREAVKLEFPAAGAYTADVTALLNFVTDQPYTLTVRHYTYDPAAAADLAGVAEADRIAALRLVYDRLLNTSGGAFRPGATLTRGELAQALAIGARVPQSYPDVPSFVDLAAGSPTALFAESLRQAGILGTGGGAFGPAAGVDRLEAAVALVRGLRLEAQAQALAGTTVTWQGTPLVDNAAIPAAFRGHVQLALDRGLFAAFPATVIEIQPGQYQAVPGPRFEPATALTRLGFVAPASRLVQLLFGEN